MVKVTCKICTKQCKGEVLKLNDSFFHIDCFKCQECKKTLANESFFTHENKYYCESDYAKKFGALCAACGRLVDDSSRAVAALGKTFHEPCFRCSRCSATFKPGDKVSLAGGKEHLCSNCVNGVSIGQRNQVQQARPMTTSTPLDKQRTTGSLQNAAPPKQKTLEKSQGYVSGHEGIDSLGASDVEEQDLPNGNHQPFRYASPRNGGTGGFNEYQTFSEDDLSRQFTSPSRGLGGAGPSGDVTNQTLDGSRSHLSRNRTVQFEPKFRSQFGQHITGSYLNHTSYLRRAGSTPPAGAPPQAKPPSAQSPHFNRPDNFSYRHPTKRFVRAKKGGLVQLMEFNARQASDKVAGEIREEAIKQSHFANARAPTPQDVPAIERDDFPAPPASVNVIGHKLRSKDELDGDQEKTTTDPKLARDLDQLEQLAHDRSGVAEVILRELQNRALHAADIDPRSASRVPAADHEPPVPTRYMSAMFASPSRFSDHPRSNRFFSTPPPGAADDVDRHGATLPAGMAMSHIRAEEPIDPRSKTMPISAANVTTSPRAESATRQQYASESDLDVDNTLYYKQHYKAATLSDVCPTYLSEQAGLKHSLGQLPSQQQPQVFSYDQLKGGVSNAQLPKTANRNHLEVHLAPEEFERLFQMPKDTFYKQPEWKQNDLKRRAQLL